MKISRFFKKTFCKFFLVLCMQFLLLSFLGLIAAENLPLFSPVQIVRPNAAHTGFEPVKETIAKLASLGRSKKIAIISVVGPYHSGKSFLLNALIGKTDVFSVGPKTSPETMGLWLARTNLTVGAAEQAEVWFLDSEGFFGPQVPENYDAKTFTLSLLLGDEFVYNTVKIIDSQAVGLLEMLARRAQLFRTKTEAGMPGVLKLTPHLTWVVEDFVQASEEGQSKTRWLEQYLKSDGVDQPYLKKIFPNLSVKSLFLPATSRQALADLSKVPFSDLTAEFRSDLTALKESILTRLNGRKEKFISATELAQSVQFLSGALDKGLFPELPSLWDSWKSQVVTSSMQDAVELFDSTLRSKIDSIGASDNMPSVDEFNHIIGSARNASLVFYRELVGDFINGGSSKSLEQLLASLEEQLKNRYQSTLSTFQENMKTVLKERSRFEFSKFLQQVPQAYEGQDLVEPAQLHTQLNQFALVRVQDLEQVAMKFESKKNEAVLPETWVPASFPTSYKTHPVDELRVELQNQIDSLLVENDKGIANVMKASAVVAVKSVDDVLTNNSAVLMSLDELEKFSTSVVEKAVLDVFPGELGRPWMKAIHPLFEQTTQQIKLEIEKKLNQFRRAHEERLHEWFKKNSEKALGVYRDMKRTIEVSLLPLDESDLVREHARAVTALVTSLDSDLGAAKFNASNPYRGTRSSLDSIVDQELQKLKKKNIELWKVHSDEATQCAFELNSQYVGLNCPQGWFCWFKVWPGAHKRRSTEHLMHCFAQGRNPPSESIRTQIFESWYEKELGKEVAEVRSNMWIALVSLLVPIAWIFYIKKA